MNNTGLQNEEEIVKSLNHKKIKNLNKNLQNMIRSMFGEKTGSLKLSCKKTDNYIKPDLVVNCGGKEAYVSVKTGHSSQFHTENIKSFILFLRSIGISKETQKTILLYHYGDGTMDGSGDRRLNYHQTYDWLKERIDAANKELNDRYETIYKVIERVVFQGVDETAHGADFIYLGDIDFGVVISKRQMYSYVKKKSWSFYDNLHIGPILLRPHARYSDRAIVSDEGRNHICCYWSHLNDDLRYIDKHFAI